MKATRAYNPLPQPLRPKPGFTRGSPGKVFPDDLVGFPRPELSSSMFQSLRGLQQKFQRMVKFAPTTTVSNEPRVVDHRTPKMIVIHHPSNKWTLEQIGGLGVWVNPHNNDVSLERPPHPASEKTLTVTMQRSAKYATTAGGGPSLKLRRNTSAELMIHGDAVGVVGQQSTKTEKYHNPEMKELFRMLDGNQSQSRKINSITRQSKPMK